jgi:hypothetical protein
MIAEPNDVQVLLEAAVPDVPVEVDLADVRRRVVRQRRRLQLGWGAAGAAAAMVLTAGGVAVQQSNHSAAPVTSPTATPTSSLAQLTQRSHGRLLSIAPGIDPVVPGLGRGKDDWAQLLPGRRLALEVDDALCPVGPRSGVFVGEPQQVVLSWGGALAAGGDESCFGTVPKPYTAIFQLPADISTTAPIQVESDWMETREMTIPANADRSGSVLSFHQGIDGAAKGLTEASPAKLLSNRRLAVLTYGDSCPERPVSVTVTGSGAVTVRFGAHLHANLCLYYAKPYTTIVGLPAAISAQGPLEVTIESPSHSAHTVLAAR